MAVARFTVTTVGFDKLDVFIAGVEARILEPRPWLNDAADKMELLAAQAFTDEGPRWRPLARSTQTDRRRKGYPAEHPILVRKGDLKASATKRGRGHVRRFKGTRSIEVGSRDFKAFFHERGTRFMPARPFLVVTADDATLFRMSAGDYVMGRWARASGAGAATGSGVAA